MIKGGLSDLLIEELLASGVQQRLEFSDTQQPRLRLRLGPRGARWSVLVRSKTGRRVRRTIGEWPSMLLCDAREAATQIRDGEPVGELSIREPRLTVLRLSLRYYEEYLQELVSGEKTATSLRAFFIELNHKEVCTLTQRDIAKEVERIGLNGPVHAYRSLAYAKAMFAWGMRRGLITGNPARGIRMRRPQGTASNSRLMWGFSSYGAYKMEF